MKSQPIHLDCKLVTHIKAHASIQMLKFLSKKAEKQHHIRAVITVGPPGKRTVKMQFIISTRYNSNKKTQLNDQI